MFYGPYVASWLKLVGITALLLFSAACAAQLPEQQQEQQQQQQQEQQQQQQQQGQERPQLEEHETYRVLSDSHASNSAQQIKFRSAFNLSLIAVTVLNVVFALHAWKSYGDCTAQDDKSKLRCVQPNVIDNLKSGASSTTVKVLLCCDLLFTSVLFLFGVPLEL